MGSVSSGLEIGREENKEQEGAVKLRKNGTEHGVEISGTGYQDDSNTGLSIAIGLLPLKWNFNQ